MLILMDFGTSYQLYLRENQLHTKDEKMNDVTSQQAAAIGGTDPLDGNYQEGGATVAPNGQDNIKPEGQTNTMNPTDSSETNMGSSANIEASILAQERSDIEAEKIKMAQEREALKQEIIALNNYETERPPLDQEKMLKKLNFLKGRRIIAQNEAANKVDPELGEEGRQLAKRKVSLYAEDIAELEAALK